MTSELGTINNLIQVKKSDFEVFDALQVDSLECSDASGRSLLTSDADVNNRQNNVMVISARGQICPVPPLVRMGRNSTSADRRRISKPRPSSLLTSSKSFSTRTQIYL